MCNYTIKTTVKLSENSQKQVILDYQIVKNWKIDWDRDFNVYDGHRILAWGWLWVKWDWDENLEIVPVLGYELNDGAEHIVREFVNQYIESLVKEINDNEQ